MYTYINRDQPICSNCSRIYKDGMNKWICVRRYVFQISKLFSIKKLILCNTLDPFINLYKYIYLHLSYAYDIVYDLLHIDLSTKILRDTYIKWVACLIILVLNYLWMYKKQIRSVQEHMYWYIYKDSKSYMY